MSVFGVAATGERTPVFNTPGELVAAGFHAKHVASCVRGSLPHHKGYVWFKAGCEVDMDDVRSRAPAAPGVRDKRSRRMGATAPDGSEVVVTGFADAAKRFGLDRSNITRALKGELPHVRGFRNWRYLD